MMGQFIITLLHHYAVVVFLTWVSLLTGNNAMLRRMIGWNDPISSREKGPWLRSPKAAAIIQGFIYRAGLGLPTGLSLTPAAQPSPAQPAKVQEPVHICMRMYVVVPTIYFTLSNLISHLHVIKQDPALAGHEPQPPRNGCKYCTKRRRRRFSEALSTASNMGAP